MIHVFVLGVSFTLTQQTEAVRKVTDTVTPVFDRYKKCRHQQHQQQQQFQSLYCFSTVRIHCSLRLCTGVDTCTASICRVLALMFIF